MATTGPPPSSPERNAAAAAQQLSNAAFNDQITEVEALLASGVPVDAKDPDGFTALHRACVKGNVSVVQLLLVKGANVNVEDAYGDTPLHYACFCGHIEAVRTLINGGANPYKKSSDGKTPLQSALDENHQHVVQLIAQMVPPPADAAGAAPAAPTFAAPTAPATTPPTATKPIPKANSFFGKFLGGDKSAAAAAPAAAAGPQSPMAVAGLDFSRGVIIQGALSKKRANKVLAWRQKYYVLSSLYNALFFWTGTADRVEGVIKKVRFETFLSVKLLPEKKGGRRFDLRVITGRTMQLLAGTSTEASKWVTVLNEVVGKLMASVRIQAVWRGHRARKELKKIEVGRQKVVALIAAGAAGAATDGSKIPVKAPKAFGQDVSKGKKKAVPKAKGKGGAKGAAAGAGKSEEEEDVSGPAGPLSTEGVIIEGELAKRNHNAMASVFSVYRTRYFVLHREVGALVYYESKPKRSLGVNPRCIPFVSFYSTIHHMDKKGAKTKTFTLRLVSGRTFVFEARGVEDATNWVAKIDSVLPRDHLAALTLQRFIRGWRVRRMVKSLRALRDSAQAGLLGTYGKGRSLPELKKVAATVQAYMRMRAQRSKYVKVRDENRAAKGATGPIVNAPTGAGAGAGAAGLGHGTQGRLNRLGKLSALKRDLDAEGEIVGAPPGIPLPPLPAAPPMAMPPPAIAPPAVAPPAVAPPALPLPGLPPAPLPAPAALPLPPLPGAPAGGLPLPPATAPLRPAMPGMPPAPAPGQALPVPLPAPSTAAPAPVPGPMRPGMQAAMGMGAGMPPAPVAAPARPAAPAQPALPPAPAAPPAPPAAPPAQPRVRKSRWISQSDRGTGRVFYANVDTGETSWQVPAGVAAGTARIVTGHFSKVDAGSGRKFYVHATTGATSWTVPPGYTSDEEEGSTAGRAPALGGVVDVSYSPFDGGAIARPARPSLPAAGVSAPVRPPGGPRVPVARTAPYNPEDPLGVPVDAAEAAAVAKAMAEHRRVMHERRSAMRLLALRSTRGDGAGEPGLLPPLPRGWTEIMDDTRGKAEYVCLTTGAARHERPAANAAGQLDEEEEEDEDADGNEVLTFSLWANDVLTPLAARPRPGAAIGPFQRALATRVPVSDEGPTFVNGFRDGILLCALAATVFPGSLDPRAVDMSAVPGARKPVPGGGAAPDGQPLSYSPAAENARLAMAAAEACGVPVPRTCTGEAIEAGSAKAVLDACYALLHAHAVRHLDLAGLEGSGGKLPVTGLGRLAAEGETVDDLLRVSPDRLLLRWINYHLGRAPGGCTLAGEVDCFGRMFADGAVLCALVRTLLPELSSEVPKTEAGVRAMGPEAAVTAALSAAFGAEVPPWFSVEGMMEAGGNPRLQTLLCAFLFEKAPRLDTPLGPAAKPAPIPASLLATPHALTACPGRLKAWAGGAKKALLRNAAAAVVFERELSSVLSSNVSGAPAGSLSGVPQGELPGLALSATVLSHWINMQDIEGLRLRGSKGLSMLRELKDGLALLQLLDVVEPGLVQWPTVHLSARNTQTQTENCNAVVGIGRAMELMNQPGCAELATMTGDAIVSCRARETLSFAWQVMRYAVMRDLALFTGVPMEEANLLHWANGCVAAAVGQHGEHYKVRSWGDRELRSGMYLCYLLSHLRPGVVDWAAVTEGETREQQLANAGYILSLARKMGAYPAVSKEDIVEARPRALAMLAASLLLADQRMRCLATSADDEE